jgi:hypothetical protein
MKRPIFIAIDTVNILWSKYTRIYPGKKNRYSEEKFLPSKQVSKAFAIQTRKDFRYI